MSLKFYNSTNFYGHIINFFFLIFTSASSEVFSSLFT